MSQPPPAPEPEPARRRPARRPLGRAELLSIRLMPVLRQQVSFAASQSGLGLNSGCICVAPKSLLSVIHAASAAGAAQPLPAEPAAAPASDRKRRGVPFDVWLPGSPWSLWFATLVAAARFLLAMQLRGLASSEPPPEGLSPLLRLSWHVFGDATAATLFDLAWSAGLCVLLHTLHNLALHDSGLQQGWVDGSPFVLDRPGRRTREFRHSNTARARIERLQSRAREHLQHAVTGLCHTDRNIVVADASAGLVYGPTLLTAGLILCAASALGSVLTPAGPELEACSRALSSHRLPGSVAAAICIFEQRTAHCIVLGQVAARACLFLAVRLDELQALRNRAAALHCLAIVEDVDDYLDNLEPPMQSEGAKGAGGNAQNTGSAQNTIAEHMRLNK